MYKMAIKKNGVGLSGHVILILNFPGELAHISSMTFGNGSLHVAVSGYNGGIYCHTVMSHHKLCIIEGGIVHDWAGGMPGDQDGHIRTCQFGQPTGIAVERHCNVYVTDAQVGSVKPIVDLASTAHLLRHIGILYQALKGHRLGDAGIQNGMEAVQQVDTFITETSRMIERERSVRA